MLRTLLATSLLSLMLSCAHKDAGKSFLRISGQKPESQSPIIGEADSSYYIGYVDYFPETREFYTMVSYRDGHEYPDEDLLESKLDSVIIYDDDWGRERLPMEEASRLLMLDGLDTLAIFNRKHEPVCECPLQRVEYVWDGLESYFVAVFKANEDFPGQSEELFGMSADIPHEHLNTFAAEELRDDTFDGLLLRKLKIDVREPWEMRHYQIEPLDATYSVLSSWSEAPDRNRSYLTFFERNKAVVLNEEINNFHYLNLLPVPLFVNGKPLLLISVGYPSSDVVWDYLAAYNGSQYEALDHNRVHLRQLAQPEPLVLTQRH